MNKLAKFDIKAVLVVLFVITNMYPKWLPTATAGQFCQWQALSILLLTAYTAIPFTETPKNYICRWGNDIGDWQYL